MGADIDFKNQEVIDECIKWGEWYVDTTKIDGFRLDAVKHIDAEFYSKWLKTLREKFKKEHRKPQGRPCPPPEAR